MQFQTGSVPAKILRCDNIITDAEGQVPDCMYLTPYRSGDKKKTLIAEAEPNEKVGDAPDRVDPRSIVSKCSEQAAVAVAVECAPITLRQRRRTPWLCRELIRTDRRVYPCRASSTPGKPGHIFVIIIFGRIQDGWSQLGWREAFTASVRPLTHVWVVQSWKTHRGVCWSMTIFSDRDIDDVIVTVSSRFSTMQRLRVGHFTVGRSCH